MYGSVTVVVVSVPPTCRVPSNDSHKTDMAMAETSRKPSCVAEGLVQLIIDSGSAYSQVCVVVMGEFTRSQISVTQAPSRSKQHDHAKQVGWEPRGSAGNFHSRLKQQRYVQQRTCLMSPQIYHNNRTPNSPPSAKDRRVRSHDAMMP